MALALAGWGLLAGIFPLFESDLFWHLAAGRTIVEARALPRVDPFRFSSDGASWVDHEWGFQLAVRGVEVAAGLDGLIALRAVALALFALLLFVAGRRAGLGAGAAGLVALAAALGARPRFLVRPELVTLFAIVLLLHGLDSYCRASPAQKRRAALAPLLALVVVWVNFHGEALLAPLLALLFLAGALFSRSPGTGGRVGVGSVVVVPALLAAVLLVNPYGWRLLEVPLGIARALRDLTAQNPEWSSAFASPQPYLFGGLVAVAALACAARRRNGAWPAPAWGLPTMALGLLALTGVRHQALFFAVAAPFAARCLAGLSPALGPESRRERPFAWAAIALAAGSALWCAFPPQSGPLRPRHGGLTWGLGLAPGRFPVRMAERLAARPAIGPLYNELVHGGYLLWRLHPPRRVFIDGRMELEPELLGEIARARSNAETWDEFLGRQGVVGALVRYESRRVPVYEPDGRGGFAVVGESTANALLFPSERWALVDWDDESQLFLRPGALGWEGAPYRFVQPEDVTATLSRANADLDFRQRVAAELDRKLAEQPDCQRALWLRKQIAALAQPIRAGADGS